MIRRNLFAAAILTASLTLSPVVYASTFLNSPVSAMFGKSKGVKITLVNDSGTPMELKAGDDVIKLDSNKPVTVSLPAGTHLLATASTAGHPAGSLIADVEKSLNGATLHIK
jgi:hypothetical protein